MSELKKIFLFEVILQENYTEHLACFHQFVGKDKMVKCISEIMYEREHDPHSEYSPISDMAEAVAMAECMLDGEGVYIGDDYYRIVEIELNFPLVKNEKHYVFGVRYEEENDRTLLLVSDNDDEDFKDKVVSWFMDELGFEMGYAEEAWDDMHDSDSFGEFYYQGDSYTIEEV